MARAAPFVEGRQFVEGLLAMDGEARFEVRRAIFRQAVAALGIAAESGRPSPLEGADPEALLGAVRVARADGLWDDADWRASPVTAASLYDLAGALPLGEDRIELARVVLGEVYRGGAATFVAVATRMARGSARGLTGAGIRARVALSLFLPLSTEIPVDELALSMLSRRDLSRQWLDGYAVGSLPERRLAGRLLERAARRAAALARMGMPVHTLDAEDRPGDFRRTLLEDRETLVWRHAATARGLLVDVVDGVADRIEADLSPTLGPTEWRRAATSLVASLACRPEPALARAHALIRGPLPERDPGVIVAMAWGLAAAADVEPEAAEDLLTALVRASPIAIAEGLLDLRAEVPGFGSAAIRRSAQALLEGARATADDPSLAVLARSIGEDLEAEDPAAATPAGAPHSSLRRAVHGALVAYGGELSATAYAAACNALEVARRAVAELETGDVDPLRTISLVRELDGTLLESSTLSNLLLLSRRGSDEESGVGPLEELEDKLARWLLERESTDNPEPTRSMRQLKALLHAVDGERIDRAEDPAWRARSVARWTATAGALTARLARDVSSPLRRAMAATVGRAFDGLVRDGTADVADVFLFAATTAKGGQIVAILAEASRHPDVRAVLGPLSRFMEPATRPRDALLALVRALPTGASSRMELVHGSLSRLAAAIACIQTADSLVALIPAPQSSSASPVDVVEDEVETLAHLTAGASQRCAANADHPPPTVRASGIASPSVALRRLLASQHEDRADLREATRAWSDRLAALLPTCFGDLCRSVMENLAALPATQPVTTSSLLPPSQPMPTWLPPRRTLGGFYVKRPLGRGNVGTVFLVVRAEERHDANAAQFALKVPDYDERAARSLSEAEFLRLFREEAGTLLALPEHPNLAGFVTFDAKCRPKPILVMELVEGVRCDELIESRRLTVRAALDVLFGVAGGLETMHRAGIAHLDVKPSNVILRNGSTPVLVDFGLSGRRIRPGCGTGAYGAPEVWAPQGEDDPSPLAADVYAVGCMAFELLTAKTLFEGKNEMAVIAAQLAHDGMPEPVRRIAKRAGLERLGMLLFSCLRREPRDRITMTALRREIDAIAPGLTETPWPVSA